MIYQFKILLFASCIISTLCFPNSCGPSNTKVTSSKMPENDHVTVLNIFEPRVRNKLLSVRQNGDEFIYFKDFVCVYIIIHGIDITEGSFREAKWSRNNIAMTIDEAMVLYRDIINELLNGLADELRSKTNKYGYIPMGVASFIFKLHKLDEEILAKTLYKLDRTPDHLLKCQDIIKLLK
ncbi:uncharacterized protein LOC126896895 isoform X2 [Daktulosphaira vitifoliae]|uniref:uncharacterized protein LOC126896895 isoform X1 n=1 Tax=Daktulosphaira vitifoliae TaxID=58002 RepID=UPI0021AA4E54|nr:uncharacterized protein LOC126896895 isoform X1 [Daktulosphaira vitifoliae]XP_050526021.1 uncharacterized protein LOC126896895 isoform X2 [Daktulosphaira vitifoliae]